MGVMSDVRYSSPVVGVFWMIVTGLLFVAVTAIVKYLGTAIPAVEAAFFTLCFGTCPIDSDACSGV